MSGCFTAENAGNAEGKGPAAEPVLCDLRALCGEIAFADQRGNARPSRNFR